jgi:intergrase/recombinase
MKEVMKLKDFEKNRANPFVDKAIENIETVKKKQFINTSNKSEVQVIINNEGEAVGHSAFMRFIEVDEDKFTKFYLSQFEAFWDLPKSAIRVFGYIMQQLKPKNDRFDFFMDDCLEYTKYKNKKQVYEGLTSLCQNGIIARGYNENVYFINPLIVFNGDRVTFAKTYIKKKKSKQVDPNQAQISFSSESDYEDQ